MGKLIHILLGMAVTATAYSQPAPGSNTSPQTTPNNPTKTAAVAKTPNKAVSPVNPMIATSSRFVGPDKRKDYVNTLSATFSMRFRETDPFGQPEDPDAKPVIKMVASKSAPRASQAAQTTPFPDIVRLIKITTIMPAEKSFLIDTRLIKKGQRIPLNFRNKQIPIEVTEVTSREIVFKNLDTGEIASRQLDILPGGMTPGKNGISVPGMVPNHPNAPIELESADPLLENAQNR